MLLQLVRSYRFWLCGPVAFLLSVLVMLGMAVWFPKGVGNIDNIIMPLLSFPLIWALLFFYGYLEQKIFRISSVYLTIFLIHIGLLAYHFNGAH